MDEFISLRCPNCGNWEEQTVDQPRSDLGSFTHIPNDKKDWLFMCNDCGIGVEVDFYDKDRSDEEMKLEEHVE